jgi:hypothetical protein
MSTAAQGRDAVDTIEAELTASLIATTTPVIGHCAPSQQRYTVTYQQSPGVTEAELQVARRRVHEILFRNTATPRAGGAGQGAEGGHGGRGTSATP